MAIDTFMQFTTYNGLITSSESQADLGKTLPPNISNTPGATFEVDNFTFDVEQTLNIGSQSSGAGAGKVAFNPLQISRRIDAFSPTLFQMACAGTPFKFVRVFLRKNSGSGPGEIFLIYTFKLVAVKEISFISSDDTPGESVTFEYGGLSIDYSKQKADGSLSPVPTVGWDRVRNVADNSATSITK